jgi:hypothetical protein
LRGPFFVLPTFPIEKGRAQLAVLFFATWGLTQYLRKKILERTGKPKTEKDRTVPVETCHASTLTHFKLRGET